MHVCGNMCLCTHVASWSERVPGDPGVIGLVTTRTMWHLQVSAVLLPAELAWSQLELCHLDWPQLKWPVWDPSRVRGFTGHNKNISRNTNLLYFTWTEATMKDRERDNSSIRECKKKLRQLRAASLQTLMHIKITKWSIMESVKKWCTRILCDILCGALHLSVCTCLTPYRQHGCHFLFYFQTTFEYDLSVMSLPWPIQIQN